MGSEASLTLLWGLSFVIHACAFNLHRTILPSSAPKRDLTGHSISSHREREWPKQTHEGFVDSKKTPAKEAPDRFVKTSLKKLCQMLESTDDNSEVGLNREKLKAILPNKRVGSRKLRRRLKRVCKRNRRSKNQHEHFFTRTGTKQKSERRKQIPKSSNRSAKKDSLFQNSSSAYFSATTDRNRATLLQQTVKKSSFDSRNSQDCDQSGNCDSLTSHQSSVASDELAASDSMSTAPKSPAVIIQPVTKYRRTRVSHSDSVLGTLGRHAFRRGRWFTKVKAGVFSDFVPGLQGSGPTPCPSTARVGCGPSREDDNGPPTNDSPVDDDDAFGSDGATPTPPDIYFRIVSITELSRGCHRLEPTPAKPDPARKKMGRLRCARPATTRNLSALPLSFN